MVYIIQKYKDKRLGLYNCLYRQNKNSQVQMTYLQDNMKWWTGIMGWFDMNSADGWRMNWDELEEMCIIRPEEFKKIFINISSLIN